MSELVAVAAIISLAAAAQTASGFGFALLAIPLLSLVVSAKTAVVGTALAGPLLTGVIVARERGHVDGRTVVLVSVASFLGMPLGIWVITHSDERALTLAIASVVLVFTVLMALGIEVSGSRATDLTAGVASGILTTSTGTSGPPIVIAYQAKGMAPASFRASLACTFLAQATVAVASFAVAGQITADAWRVAAASVPGLVAGWMAGQWLFAHVSAERFRGVVLGMLAVSVVLSASEALLR